MDAIEGASGGLQDAVGTPLRGAGGALGLSSGEAAFSAGVATNLILAPITGPLGEAATYIEVAGIIIGLATGAHPLVLACIKPLAHSQLEHALSQCFVKLISGWHTAGPQPDGHTSTMRDSLEQSLPPPSSLGNPPPTQPMEPDGIVVSGPHPTPNSAPNTRNEPPWVCVGFVSKPPEAFETASGIGYLAPLLGDVYEGVVLPEGDDEFVRTLPQALQRSTVCEVDVATAKTMSNPPDRQDLILRSGGIGVGLHDQELAV